MAGLKKAEEQYDKRGGSKTVDIDFSFRRNTRQPLDESSVPSSYAVMNTLLKDPTSNIYKGQILTTQGPEDSNNLTYYSPWLVKQQSGGAYVVDRVMTYTYVDILLGSIYVKKTQLGTTYTGVGKWIDGNEDGLDRTATYSEIFNDYSGNKISSKASYAHVEGLSNSTESNSSHVEGGNNVAYSNASYSHVEGSFNQLGRNDQISADALANVHVEGKSNIVIGVSQGAHAEGVGNQINNGKFAHVGGNQNKVTGENGFAHGIGLSVAKDGVGFGSYNTVNPMGFAIGSYNTTSVGADWSFVNGSNNVARGKASHAEGNNTYSNGDYSHSEGNTTYSNGTSSHSEGYKTFAQENYSHSEGYGTYSSAESSHAEGNQTQVVGKYGHSEGFVTTARGEASHSEGYYTETQGKYSHAEGSNTISNGESSHAEGSNTKAKGISSHSEGSKTEVDGNYSHAEGYGNTIDGSSHYSHVEGSTNTITNSQYSHAEGARNGIDSANYAHVEGNQNAVTANANYAHAEGFQTKAEGESSHSEGNNTEAKGKTSHSEGNNTVAQGDNSHSEGNNTKAIGNSSHSEGTDTTANGNFSHSSGKSTSTGSGGEAANAEGISTQANGEGSHSEGYYTTAGFVNKEGKLTKANHAEGSFTYAAGDYSHSEGHLTQSYGTASKSSGLGTIVRGDYGMAHGFYSASPNKYEISFGSYNRAYTTADGLGAENIKKVPNEFARIAGNYIPGRYPDGIKDSNRSTVAYYDDSYQSIFTIGNGTSDNKYSVDPLSKASYTVNGVVAYKDAGQQVKEGGRHNIMDIRKNGQMYYDGGMIIGGETVAPVSYSYVNSLGPTAYLTTVMRALLVQPEYYRPSLQYAIWYTGASSVTGATSSNSVGWAYFQSNTDSNAICEVGMTTQLKLGFRAFNVGVDKPKRIDPLYGTPLGNMLGYSTGVTNVAYQIISSNTNASAQSFVSKQGNELLAGMKEDNIRYQAKRLDLKNYDYGAYYCAYCNAVDNKGPFYNNNAASAIKNTVENDYQIYSTGLYSSQQVLTTNLKLDKEGSFTVWKATSYTFNPATQMYFQQLMEKNTYIPDDGFAPLDKFGKTTVTSTAKFTIHARYRIYYGVTNAVPSDKWKDWTQADLLNSTTYGLGSGGNGRGQVYGNEKTASGNPQSVTQQFNSTVKTCWFAFPEDIYKLGRYNTAAVPSDKFMWYRNAMNAESSLDTGRITDAISSARPMYEYITNNPISPSNLKYHIVAVSAPGGITKGTWGFTFVRK